MEKNKIMMVVIILLLVLLLGTIVGISWYVLTEMRKDPIDGEITPAPVVEVKLDELVTFSAGEVRRNLLPQGTRNWLMVATYSFEIDKTRDKNGEFVALLNNKLDMVRDIINTLVGNTTYEDVSALNGTERLKEQILEEVSEAFQTNLIMKVNLSEVMYAPITSN